MTAWICALVSVGLSAYVYYPITRNYFFGDDFLNLYQIVNGGLGEYLLRPHGGHMLVARNAVFHLCATAFGTNPEPYFWLALLTHLANVLLLFLVIRSLTQSALLAGFGATLWGTSPVHEGTLGWYSVYGHVMAGSAMLVALLLIARAAHAGTAPSPRVLRACWVLGVIAAMSFGVGMGIAMALPVVVAGMTPAATAGRRWALLSLVVAIPLLYLGYFWLNGDGLETPRLLTTYALRRLLYLPSHFVDLLSYGLLRLGLAFAFRPDDVNALTSYAVFACATLAVLVVALRSSAAVRGQLLACVALTVGCYGFIAAGRTVFFERATATLVAIQPRYHYAALIPVTLIVCLVLARVGAAIRVRGLEPAMFVLWIAALMTTYRQFGFPIDHHGDMRHHIEVVLAAIYGRVAMRQPGHDAYIINRPLEQVSLVVPMHDFPGWAAVYVIFHDTNVLDGHPIYFIERGRQTLQASMRGKRSEGLLVPPSLVNKPGALAEEPASPLDLKAKQPAASPTPPGP